MRDRVRAAVANGAPWPVPGIPDTPQTRAWRDEMLADLDTLPPGVEPEIPWDYADDDEPDAGTISAQIEQF